MSDLWTFDPYIEQPEHSIVDYAVEATDGSIGTVESALSDGSTAFLVVTVGKLLGKKHVVIPSGLVKQFNPEAEKVFLRASKADVEAAPEFDPEHDPDWRSDPSWRDRVASCFPATTR